MMKRKSFDAKLDLEEQELLRSVENGEWKRANDFKEQVVSAREAASNTLRKNQRITLRLTSSDLVRLKQKAIYKGLPYQILWGRWGFIAWLCRKIRTSLSK